MSVLRESKKMMGPQVELAKASETVRNKLRALKTLEKLSQSNFEKTFEPIVTPLRSIEKSVKGGKRKQQTTSSAQTRSLPPQQPPPSPPLTPPPQTQLAQQVPSTSRSISGTPTASESINVGNVMKYVGAVYSSDLDSNSPYSVRVRDGKFFINQREVSFDETNNGIRVGDTVFPATSGLYRLIFLKKPVDFTLDDLEVYSNILDAVNALYAYTQFGKRRLKPVKQSPKYEMVRDFLSTRREQTRKKKKKRGGGVACGLTSKKNASMRVNDKSMIEYVHWDDPNELVERLRLLYASKQAGNTSHENEIISIVSELREEGIIV